MNLDDESQISAFLDDELDPGDRPVVAWSVESSPLLAQQLAEIQATQTLLQGLDRPAIPLDLTAAIMTRIAVTRHPKTRRTRTGAMRFAATLVGVASVAASLLVAIVVLHRTLHQNLNPVVVADSGADIARSHPFHDTLRTLAPAAPAPAPNAPATKTTPVVAMNLVGGPTTAPELAKWPAAGVAEPSTVAEVEPVRPVQVDTMLGHRQVVRALIVTDVLDQAARKVQALIELDGAREPDFGRITLAQGIVIDPDQPGQAEVYSMVVARPGLQPFLDRLRAAFPGMTFSTETEPTLITQLTEIGQVEVFSDVGPARLKSSPPHDVQQALVAAKGAASPDPFLRSTVVRVDPTSDHPGEFPPPAEASSLSPGPGAVDRAKTLPSLAQVPGGADLVRSKAPAPPDHEPVTVLVWVARTARP